MIPLHHDHAKFTAALPVLEIIHDHGHEAYFVGGCIRDTLLALPIHDIDIATSAFPVEIQAIFPKHFDVGLEHGTVMVWYEGATYEVTTFRTESEYQDYRRPLTVEFVQSLAEDLKRRDFTMNALAMTSAGEIIDYFGGQADIENKCIRAVGCPKERFSEDALRMMRAVRFASQLDFQVEQKTMAALTDSAPLLKKIAVERILVEMNKLWSGVNWQRGIALLLASNLVNFCPALSDFSPSLKQMGQQLDADIKLPNSNFAWAVLLYFDYKSQTNPAQSAQTLKVSSFTKAWKMSNADAAEIQAITEALIFRAENNFWTNWQLYQWGEALCLQIEHFIANQQQHHSGFGVLFSAANPARVNQIWANLPIYSLKELAIDGKVIIAEFAPQDKRLIGQALKFCETQVVTGQVANQKAALLELSAAEFFL